MIVAKRNILVFISIILIALAILDLNVFIKMFTYTGLYIFSTLFAITLLTIDYIRNGSKPFKISLYQLPTSYILFGVYILCSGSVIFLDKNLFFTNVFRYFMYAMICCACYYIYTKENNITFMENIGILMALFVSISAYFFGTYIYGRLTIGFNGNANDLAMQLLVGIFFLTSNKSRIDKYWLFCIPIICFLIYLIILTGSRKVLIASAFLFTLWFVEFIKEFIISSRLTMKKIFFIVILVGGSLYAINKVIQEFYGSIAYERMIDLSTSYRTDGRFDLYSEAFTTWLENPVFGVGYNQFMLVNPFKLYSHSTYAELLACTGILGFIIFLIPVVKMFVKFIQGLIIYKINRSSYEYRVLFAMFLIELFLGIGQIWFYDILHMFILMYIYIKLSNILAKSE